MSLKRKTTHLTELNLSVKNADALILGDATHEGGDIKVYRDSSGNLQLSVDADAASNVKAVDIYGGVVCQNYVTIGQTTLDITSPLYVNGVGKITGNLFLSDKCYFGNGKGIYGLSNIAELIQDIGITGTDLGSHAIKLRIDSNDIVVAQATGDGAGGITNKAIGLYGATPVVQATAIGDPAESTAGNNAAIDSILAALRGIGLIAT